MEYLATIITSASVAALINGVFAIILKKMDDEKKISKTEKALIKGVQVLLCDRIKSLGREYISNGSITLEQFEDIERMNKVYHDELSGNGYCKHIMEAVELLPIEIKKED